MTNIHTCTFTVHGSSISSDFDELLSLAENKADQFFAGTGCAKVTLDCHVGLFSVVPWAKVTAVYDEDYDDDLDDDDGYPYFGGSPADPEWWDIMFDISGGLPSILLL